MIDYLNNNPGVVAIALFVLGIIGFFLKRFLFRTPEKNFILQKQKSGDGTVNIQSGRDTNYESKQSKIRE